MSQSKQPGRTSPRSDSSKRTSNATNTEAATKAVHAAADDIKDGLKDDAAALKNEAIEQAKSFAETHKETVADVVGGVAKAAKSAADDLEKREQSEAARMVRDVAGGLDRFADTVADNDMSQLMTKAQTFAQRQPAAFLGGAVLLGLALSRFAKSTAERDEADSSNQRS